MRFGQLFEITIDEYVDSIDNSPQNVPVIIHLYQKVRSAANNNNKKKKKKS